ncbi:MAG TPA: hypothetical protein VLB29_13130 [Nocardioidaceae bacterium]|nr:hypothetical protein [Nocardioidaceae bacterium]
MLTILGLVGLALIAYAMFRLGRGARVDNPAVLATGAIGLLSALALGILAGLIVGGGAYLVGKGTAVEGGRGVAFVLAGTGVLAVPLLLLGLFYLASQAA